MKLHFSEIGINNQELGTTICSNEKCVPEYPYTLPDNFEALTDRPSRARVQKLVLRRVEP